MTEPTHTPTPGWYVLEICYEAGPKFWLDSVTADDQWLIYSDEIRDDWEWDPCDLVRATLQWPNDNIYPLTDPPSWADTDLLPHAAH